jgi:hypothetical protein
MVLDVDCHTKSGDDPSWDVRALWPLVIMIVAMIKMKTFLLFVLFMLLAAGDHDHYHDHDEDFFCSGRW